MDRYKHIFSTLPCLFDEIGERESAGAQVPEVNLRKSISGSVYVCRHAGQIHDCSLQMTVI